MLCIFAANVKRDFPGRDRWLAKCAGSQCLKRPRVRHFATVLGSFHQISKLACRRSLTWGQGGKATPIKPPSSRITTRSTVW